MTKREARRILKYARKNHRAFFKDSGNDVKWEEFFYSIGVAAYDSMSLEARIVLAAFTLLGVRVQKPDPSAHAEEEEEEEEEI